MANISSFLKKSIAAIRQHLLTINTTDEDVVRKTSLMFGSVLIGIFFLSLLGTINLIQGERLLGTLDLLTALILFIILFFLHIPKYLSFCLYTGITITFFLFIYLFISGGIAGTGFLWSYIFPLYTFFLLGTKKGLWVSLIYFLSCLAVISIDLNSSMINHYDKDLVIRLIPSLSVVILFSYIYEKFRENSQQKLIEAIIIAETANQAKSDFLANMSHEIRTPMNGVLGVADLLLQADLSDRQRQLAQTIRASGKNLLYIINDILDFSKIEAGRLELENINFDLRELVDAIYDLFSHKTSEKGLTLTSRVQEDIPKIVHGDPVRLRQILINLIGNAIKFTSLGSIHFNAELVEQKDGACLLRFKVRDTGIGLTHKQEEGIFDAFSQADSSTTRKYGGTGLGLTISRQLVELMNGEIAVKSEPGLGASFRFTVPMQIPVDQDTAISEYRQKQQETDPTVYRFDCLVLVVEDNLTNQMVAEGMLELYGCKVDLAVNGRQAVEAAKKNTYDLILMDCQMPELDGYSATGEIREFEQQTGNFHTPIIALTAHVMSGDRDHCLIAGMDDYLGKPLQQNQLLSILKKWVPESKQRERPKKTDEKSTTPIDRSVLNALRDLQMEGNPDILERIIPAYLTSSESLIAELKKALAINDLEVFQNAAHSLKSSSASVGAIKLSEISKELEMGCRNNTLKNAVDLVSAIESEFIGVKDSLNKEIHST